MDKLNAAIEALAGKAKEAESSHEAMQYAQSALNLANTAEKLEAIRRANEFAKS